MQVYIKPNVNYFGPIKYTLGIIENHLSERFVYVNNAGEANLVFDASNENSMPICVSFYDKIDNLKLNHLEIFKSEPIINDTKGRPDLLATIFYLLNCLQEYSNDSSSVDSFGRYKYENSLQARFGVIEENLVLKYILIFCKENNIKPLVNKPSKIFISHDIDTIHGSFFQDGLWAIKNKRIDVVLKLIIKEISQNGEWNNIDQIIKLNNDFEIKSTFFWLVNKGKGTKNIKNSDYSIKKQKKSIRNIIDSGNSFGLHKSCSTDSIDTELRKIPFKSSFNRNHFLNFTLPAHWNSVEESDLIFDASLGFAEHYGFRNNYGLPFKPYNFETKQAFNFVETPLNIMDGTLDKYMHLPKNEMAKTVIDFFELNKSDSIISFLWHNTHFTHYKYNGFLDIYKEVAKYIYESKIETISPQEIINEISI